MSVFSNCELLSPAGSEEGLRQAVLFGADAVYLGGPFMQLRSEKASFSSDRLIEEVKYAHSKNVKIYVTVNCFAENEEIEKLKDYAKFLYSIGADAAIVSDLGAIYAMKSACPELEIHVSTQANIQNFAAAEVYYNMGCKRVVLGREMTLENIAELRAKTPKNLDIEVFVHGAMCMAYSGRCLLSSYLTGRSGNRGECTQPCRWMYKLVEEKRPGQTFDIFESDSTTAILSSHDLNTIDFLDKIAEAGAISFKIEGRMKSPFYVSTVTNAYKMRMNGFADLDALNDELCAVSHRPYNSGFFFNNIKYDPNNDGLYRYSTKFIGTVTDRKDSGLFEIEMRNRFASGDMLETLSPGKIGKKFRAEKMYDMNLNARDEAYIPQEHVLIETDENLKPGDIIRKRVG